MESISNLSFLKQLSVWASPCASPDSIIFPCPGSSRLRSALAELRTGRQLDHFSSFFIFITYVPVSQLDRARDF